MIMYVNAVRLLPTRRTPKGIQENGGYKVFLPNGQVTIVQTSNFLNNYKKIEEGENATYPHG